jgi:DNA-binding CsgD family transcriptional regulator
MLAACHPSARKTEIRLIVLIQTMNPIHRMGFACIPAGIAISWVHSSTGCFCVLRIGGGKTTPPTLSVFSQPDFFCARRTGKGVRTSGTMGPMEIAAILGISPRTVHKRVEHPPAKLNGENRSELRRFGMELHRDKPILSRQCGAYLLRTHCWASASPSISQRFL